jgi:mannosyltransferase OCH1-like enzyme
MNPLIPKILHQIWIGPKPAPTNLMKTWKEKHPDFEYILWTENEIIKRKLELKCIDKIMMINEINGKADIIRWEILYQYGGYFVDADSICIEPFDEIFYDKPAFATFENENVRNGLVATGTMGFIPKYSLCLDIINWINSNESTYVILNNRAWYSVGPALLTKMLETGKYTDFSVFPSHYFLPVHFTGSNYEGHKKVYGYQEWGTAKNSYDTMNNIVLPKELLPPPIDNWVSILITSYNTIGFFINECLTSIKNQTGYFGIELVWINDGSNDESTYILERELMNFEKTTRFTKVVYHKNDINIGHAKSLNKGISLCTNELIIKMDSDDITLLTIRVL